MLLALHCLLGTGCWWLVAMSGCWSLDVGHWVGVGFWLLLSECSVPGADIVQSRQRRRRWALGRENMAELMLGISLRVGRYETGFGLSYTYCLFE